MKGNPNQALHIKVAHPKSTISSDHEVSPHAGQLLNLRHESGFQPPGQVVHRARIATSLNCAFILYTHSVPWESAPIAHRLCCTAPPEGGRVECCYGPVRSGHSPPLQLVWNDLFCKRKNSEGGMKRHAIFKARGKITIEAVCIRTRKGKDNRLQQRRWWWVVI